MAIGLTEEGQHNGSIINDLMAIVDSVIADRTEAKSMVRSALGVAYAEGKWDGIVATTQVEL